VKATRDQVENGEREEEMEEMAAAGRGTGGLTATAMYILHKLGPGKLYSGEAAEELRVQDGAGVLVVKYSISLSSSFYASFLWGSCGDRFELLDEFLCPVLGK
jgi:hypothetical protein